MYQRRPLSDAVGPDPGLVGPEAGALVEGELGLVGGELCLPDPEAPQPAIPRVASTTANRRTRRAPP